MGLQGAAWLSLLEDESFLNVLGQTGDSAELADKFEEESPAALLVDLADARPADAERLASEIPGVGILLLLGSTDAEAIAAFVGAGVSGVISRNSDSASLVRALIAVGRGELVLPDEISGRVLQILAAGNAGHEPSVEPLTEREVEVLGHLANGKTNKDIGQALMISVRTVEAHLRNIYGKLNVDSRTEAALWAVRNDLAAGSNTI